MLFGLLVAGILVGMELDRQLAERALQLRRGAGALDAEDLVVVSLVVRLHFTLRPPLQATPQT